jgi:hypothetical protein
MMDTILSPHWHLAWIIPAVLLIAYLGSPRHRGRRAFQRVRRLLRNSLDRRQYVQFHDIALPAGGGTVQIDHLLVSRFGIFIIVSEYRPGTIRGGESQELWKQRTLARSQDWPNPLHRAKLQMEALQRLLDYPRKCFQIFVAVDGQPVLGKEMPKEVVPASKLVELLRSRTQQVLTAEQADRASTAINNGLLPIVASNRRTRAAQLLLGIAVLAGVYLAYGQEILSFVNNFGERVEQLAASERFDEDGVRKSEQQIFEESLACAFSEDSMRCSCYRKGGEKVEIDAEKCRELAERGSILKQ